MIYAVLDVETTGGSPLKEKITEIAIFIFDGEQIIDQYDTLIDPEKNIPYYITGLTGITNEMVAGAPKFYEVARRIVEMTEGKLLVGHNIGFDYHFIKQEFKNLGYSFNRDCLCTVKLSRKLIPGYPSYSLGKLTSQLHIPIDDRHRAAGDARATVRLLGYLLEMNNGDEQLLKEMAGLSIRGLSEQFDMGLIHRLPERTGVYYFHDEQGVVIYVGKSKNIKKRVLSHLNNKTKRVADMKSRLHDISYELTGSENIALLLESSEIKRLTPLYNRAQRRKIDAYGLYLSTNHQGYMQLLVRKNSAASDSPLVTFSSLKLAKKTLMDIIEDYQLCQTICDLYPATNGCFQYQIGACRGACLGKEEPTLYNQRMKEACCSLSLGEESMFIFDQGRDENELSVIHVDHGKYKGYGYIAVNEVDGHPDLLKDVIRFQEDNQDVQRILKDIISRKKYQRLIYL